MTMTEKEILHLLHEEDRLELKCKRAESKAELIQGTSLQQAKVRAEDMQRAALQDMIQLKKNHAENTAIVCKKMQEKAAQKVHIIEGCHANLQNLARKTMHELLLELKANEN